MWLNWSLNWTDCHSPSEAKGLCFAFGEVVFSRRLIFHNDLHGSKQMKTNSPRVLQMPSPTILRNRSGEIMNALVLMLVAILLPAWILGTLYLSFFSPSANASGSSDSEFGANPDRTTVPSALSDASDNQTDSQGAVSQSAQGNDFAENSGTGGDFNPGQANISSGLTTQQSAAYDEKINSLQRQLDAESQEVQRLREMTSSMSGSPATADTSQFENQIAALTKERDQLKMKLTSADQSSAKIAQLEQQLQNFNQQSESQNTKIKVLLKQLVTTEEARRKAEQELLAANSKLASPPPTLASSAASNQPLEFREWISSRGSKARLAFVRWEDNRVIVVNEAGKEFRLTQSRLSLADQKYVNGKR